MDDIIRSFIRVDTTVLELFGLQYKQSLLARVLRILDTCLNEDPTHLFLSTRKNENRCAHTSLLLRIIRARSCQGHF